MVGVALQTWRIRFHGSKPTIIFIITVVFIVLFADDEFGEKTVSILLDAEESEMVFIDHPSIEMSVSASGTPRFHFRNGRRTRESGGKLL